MDRTVPSATSEEIQLYRSTIYSLLRSTAEVQIRTLEEIHAGMNSLLHPGARSSQPDIPAFLYSAMRLPACMPAVRSVILGQSSEVFRRQGYEDIETWQPISARARRRRCFYNRKDTLACYIASRSDIEDVIPALTAYQIEWNKLNLLLQRWPREKDLASVESTPDALLLLSEVLQVAPEDLERLRTIWRADFVPTLERIRATRRSIGVRLLNSSLSQYMRATHEWFESIARACPALTARPVYFVSSNTHSLANLATSFALWREAELEEFLALSNDPDLLAEWHHIQNHAVRSSRENFLYYVMKKYQAMPEGQAFLTGQQMVESASGITRVTGEHSFDVEAQVIALDQLDPKRLDPRLGSAASLDFLRRSDALILNIDYPLGLAAFHILSKVSEQALELRGVYIMGKAASLNAVRGDVIIPNVVQDEHSHNTYLFENCFTASDVTPYLTYGTVLDNQKAICVLGTFLQNVHIMDVFYREGYADIEMELGNFCSAMFEATRPKRYPLDEIVNLYNIPIDFGVLHYVSDTPMSKGKNLGAGTLSYYGMDSTYATSIAILKRIFALEQARLR
jgi:hypothetical protein